MVKTSPEQELLSPLYEDFLQTRPPGDLHIYIYVPTSHLFVILDLYLPKGDNWIYTLG